MLIKCIEIGEHGEIEKRHPELTAQHPELLSPFPSDFDARDSSFPFLFYALEGQRVIAHFNSFPDTLFDGDRAIKWAWNGGLFTDPEYRGRGVAKSLVQYQVDEFERRETVWGGVFSSPSALRIYERLDFCMMGHVQRLCLIHDLAPFIRHHTANKLAGMIGAIFGRSVYSASEFLRLAQAFRAPRRVAKIDIVQLEQIINRGLLKNPTNMYWGRDFNWFRVRLSQLGLDQIYTVMRQGDNEPCAFLIIRDRSFDQRTLMGKYTGIRVMSLMDYGRLDDGDDLDEMIISGMISLFQKSNAALLELITSSPTMQRLSRCGGFLPFGVGMSFKFKPPHRSPLRASKMELRDWHLTQYSGDAFGLE